MSRLLIGILIGVVLCVSSSALFSHLTLTPVAQTAIVVSIKNDTSHDVVRVTLKSNKGQFFSCSLSGDSCAIGIMNSGDASFSVTADLVNGKSLDSIIGYAEPGSFHQLLVSEFINVDATTLPVTHK